MSAYSEKEIVKGIINHDKTTYIYLDTLFRESVIKHTLKNSGTQEDGEELYKDVIFEIYLNIKRNRYATDKLEIFEKYFWTIAERRWINKLKKRKLN